MEISFLILTFQKKAVSCMKFSSRCCVAAESVGTRFIISPSRYSSHIAATETLGFAL